MDLITDAHFWVGIAFIVFLAILVMAGVHKFAWKALGDAGDKVRAQLDEANHLREEAQALLARIQSDREASEKLAAEIMANAQEQAKRMQAEAQERLAEQIERRPARRTPHRHRRGPGRAEVKAAAGELAAPDGRDRAHRAHRRLPRPIRSSTRPSARWRASSSRQP